MTWGFALLLSGALMLVAGVRSRPILDILRGVTDPVEGPGERGFLKELLPGGGTSGAAGFSEVAGGTTSIDGKPVAGWIAAEVLYARQHGWGGKVTSGYRSVAEQARVCSQASGPCAAPGKSNHQTVAYPGGAVDVTDPVGLFRHLRPGSRLHWTGPRIGDFPHFSSGERGV